jgi:RimJ/RimL family protein N-acetyltransferase
LALALRSRRSALSALRIRHSPTASSSSGRSAPRTRRRSSEYWLLPEARGKGLATRAVLLVARWAFGRIGVERIGLLADPRNESSVRVAERAGFKREGVLRSWTDVNGVRVDHVSFSLLRIDLGP